MVEDTNETKKFSDEKTNSEPLAINKEDTDAVTATREEKGTADVEYDGELKHIDEYESRGLIQDIWYGQRSLAYTFWVWQFLVGNLLINYILSPVVAIIARETGLSIIQYIFFALLFPYGIWIVVGLWRSATRHGGFWGGLVKFLVIIGVCAQIFMFLYFITQ